MVRKTKGNIFNSLIGGNVSTENPEGEGAKSTVISGVDILKKYYLQESSFTKEASKKYIKDHIKSVKRKFEEERQEGVKPFKTGSAK